MKIRGKKYIFLLVGVEENERNIFAVEDDYWTALKLYHKMQKSLIDGNVKTRVELWRKEINPLRRLESMENYEPMTRQEINNEEAENEGKYYDYGEDNITF